MGSSIKSDVVWRVALVYFVVLLVGLIIIAKALYIQFVEGSDLREKAQEITFRQMPISPTRGDILDVEGRLLATSVPYYELRMDLRAAGLTDEIFYDKVDSLALRLSYMFRDRSPFAYRSMLVNARRFDKGSRYFLIFPRLVNYIELKRLLTFPLLRLPKNVGGFMPVTINKRIRPNDYLAARTIGGVNESGLAVGIEGAYNHELKGQAGVVLTQRIAGRMWIPVNSEDDVSPLDGTDVVTTLDIDLQDVAQSALRRQLSSHNADHDFEGMQLNIDGIDVWTRFIGEFNAYNLLAVYATGRLLGFGREEMLTALSVMTPVAGRFEYVRSRQKITAVVDYAHTPDALDNVIATINKIRKPEQKLITVVGAGGNRDKTKRPEMARIAVDGSDMVVLTSDNPRFEKPEDILEEMKAGIPDDMVGRVLVIVDRKEAIKTACAISRPGDILLVAGKGHENYQEVNGVKHHFDDKEVLKEIFESL